MEVPALPEDQAQVVTQFVPLPPLLLQLRLVLDQFLGLARPRLNMINLLRGAFKIEKESVEFSTLGLDSPMKSVG